MKNNIQVGNTIENTNKKHEKPISKNSKQNINFKTKTYSKGGQQTIKTHTKHTKQKAHKQNKHQQTKQKSKNNNNFKKTTQQK